VVESETPTACFLALSIHSSSILANHLDPQSRTKDDDEDEEEDWDMALNRYSRFTSSAQGKPRRFAYSEQIKHLNSMVGTAIVSGSVLFCAFR
jgi:hypothetical protein